MKSTPQKMRNIINKAIWESLTALREEPKGGELIHSYKQMELDGNLRAINKEVLRMVSFKTDLTEDELIDLFLYWFITEAHWWETEKKKMDTLEKQVKK